MRSYKFGIFTKIIFKIFEVFSRCIPLPVHCIQVTITSIAFNKNHIEANDKKQFETHYLTRADQKVLLGWFHNRSYNHFNYPYDAACQRVPNIDNIADLMYYNDDFQNLAPQTTPQNGGIFYNSENYAESFLGTDNIYQYYPQPSGTLTLQALPNKSYVVNWYWTWGEYGGQIYNNSSYSGGTVLSDANGYISFAHPPTGDQDGVANTGDEYPGDWAFELVQVGAARVKHTSQNQIENPVLDINIYPNPKAGDLGSITITDMLGQTVYDAHSIQQNTCNVELKNATPGIYLVEVTGVCGKPWYAKIVVD
ncbi:MAG TPA: T9SS type A sorting domain-containing protein [Flavobacteriales bacterium]|nr:T9SS type A sorting domain-containing protein [Flavobacteriales bacterium]